MNKKFIFFALLMLSVAAMSQTVPYIITGSGTTFTATRNGEAVGAAGTIQNVIDAIRTNSNRADVEIQFGSGSELNIESSYITFSGSLWGKITLLGRITSSSTASNAAIIVNGPNVDSKANIRKTNDYAIRNSGTGKLTISGGSISGYDYVVSNASTGIVEISGGTISATGSSARAVYTETAGRIYISGTANISSENTAPWSGTVYIENNGAANAMRLIVTGGTITNRTTISGNAIYNRSAGIVEISGGIVSVTSSRAAAVRNDTIGKISISGTAVLSSSNATDTGTVYLGKRGFSAANTVTRLEITGGTIKNSVAGNVAINNDTPGSIVLGGSPDITGTIKKNETGNLRVITDIENENIFVPGEKVYTLGFDSYSAGATAVLDGREFIKNFELARGNYGLIEHNNNLAMAEFGYAFGKNGTTYILTKALGAYRIQDAIDEIREFYADEKDCSIQFGDGITPLNIGTERINFSSPDGWQTFGKAWGKITLLGKITSIGGSTIEIGNKVTIDSKADIKNLKGSAISSRSSSVDLATTNIISGTIEGTNVAIRNSRDTINILGGTILANDTVISHETSGKVNISGGIIEAKKANGIAISASYGEIAISGDPINNGSIVFSSSGKIIVENGFAPGEKNYFLDFIHPDPEFSNYVKGRIVVANGAEFLKNFVLMNSSYSLEKNGNDLMIGDPFSHSITVASGPGGTAISNTAQASNSANVRLTATPNANYRFKKWEVLNGNIMVADTSPVIFKMPNRDVAVRAVFENIYINNVTVASGPGGAATASVSGIEGTQISAEDRTQIVLAAVAENGYRFKEWEVISGGITIANTNPAVFAMPSQAVAVKAVFEAIYELTVTSGSGSGWYADGEAVAIKASVPVGKRFISWSSVIDIPGSINAIFEMPAYKTEVSAIFVADSVWSGTVDTVWYTGNKSAFEYIIKTAEQLAGLARLVNGHSTNGTYNMFGKTIRLGTNIILNDTLNWENRANATRLRTWIPIGIDNSFEGTFDGSGYAVSGVYMDAAFGNQGLFGKVGSGGIVRNIGINDSYIKGRSYSHAGALAGVNYGEISNCYSFGTVTTGEEIGGLVGGNYGIISSCYSVGAISSGNYAGGLVGYNYNNGTVSYGYYDRTVSNMSDANKGTPKTTAEMKLSSTFAGWDFNTTWDITDTINNGYPHLNLRSDTSGRYVIRGTSSFTATKDGTRIGNASQPIQTVINAIRTHADSANVEIQFGNGGTHELDIGSTNITFDGRWGKITLLGRITSSNANAAILINGPNAENKADIRKTNSYAIRNSGAGKLTISEGKISGTTSVIYNGSTGIIEINGGIISGTSSAVSNGAGGRIDINNGFIYGTDNYTVSNSAAGTINIDGGTILGTSLKAQVVNNSSTGVINISGGEVEATGDSAKAVYSTSTGIINISGIAKISSANIDAKSGTIHAANSGRLRITGGTITNTKGSVIYSYSIGAMEISGGVVSATGSGAMAIRSDSTGKIGISGTAIVSSQNASTYTAYSTYSGTIHIENSKATAESRLEITGGTIINSTFNGIAIYNDASPSSIVLGGSPNIIGSIGKRMGNISVISDEEDNNVFIPDEKVYLINYENLSGSNKIAVVNGKGFLANFELVDGSYDLREEGADIIIEDSFYKVVPNGTVYSITKSEGLYRNIQDVINSIRESANGEDCSIQFGDGARELNIGKTSILLSNANVTPKWGKVTLLGKIASGENLNNNSTIRLENLSVDSKADVRKISGGGQAFNLTSSGEETTTLTISSGLVQGRYYAINSINSSTVNVTGGIVLADSIAIHNGRINISGGNISATGLRGAAVYAQTINISGDAVITSQNIERGTVVSSGTSQSLVKITGGTIVNSAVDGDAFFTYNSSLLLGGSSNITGKIRIASAALNVISDEGDEEVFVPGERNYFVHLSSYEIGSIAVKNGTKFIENFALANEKYGLAASGDNLLVRGLVLHQITVASGENGTAKSNAALASSGTQITLTATPDYGYRLKEWESNIMLANTNPVTFAMPNKAVEARAIFEVFVPGSSSSSLPSSGSNFSSSSSSSSNSNFSSSSSSGAGTQSSSSSNGDTPELSSSSGDSGTPEPSSSSGTTIVVSSSSGATITIQSSSSSEETNPVIISRIASGQTIIQATSNAILLENLPSDAKVQIYDLRGKLIYSQFSTLNSQFIPIQTKGLYFIKINNAVSRVVVR